MPKPSLTFFCELEPGPLLTLLDQAVLADLQALKAGISLGLMDLSSERAEAVQRLNQAGIPVTAWLLLPQGQGYWFNAHNAPQAAARYDEFVAWSARYNLHWAAVGLDIEPDIHDFARFTRHPWRSLPDLLRRLLGYRQAWRAHRAYRDLSQRIRGDGFFLESYQFPLIADERHGDSGILQRLAGVVDVPVDREVWMLYTSFVRPYGPGILASYAPEAQAIALGVTGGGVEAEGILQSLPLSWDELGRDLRLAWSECDHLYIFSLEGCVQLGYLSRLKTLVWDQPILMPESERAQIDAWRGTLETALWFFERLPLVAVTAAGVALVLRRWRRRG